MRFAILGGALFAASALSSPLRKRQALVTDNVVVTDDVVVTVTVMPGSSPTSSPAAAAAPVAKQAVPQDNWGSNTWSWSNYHPEPSSTTQAQAPSSSTTTLPAPPPTSTSAPQPPTPSTTSLPPPPPTTTTPPPPPSSTSSAAPSPSPSTPASNGSPQSGGVSILSTVNKWRTAYTLSNLQWSSTLQANAQKTGTDDGGVNEKHELNPGSMAQVITPGLQTALAGKDMGGDSPFELAYVSWLCEVASDPQLANGNQCGIVKAIENMRYIDTGHHDILNSPNYSKIGCAFAPNPAAASDSPHQGLWICDLA